MTPDDLHEPAQETLFCLNLPTLPKVWDSTMLGLLKECPRKFQYVILEGWQSYGFAAHLAFGIAYHSALELFDKNRFAGMDYDEATLETIKFCMNYGARDASGKFIAYNSLYTREPTKTRDTLLRATTWYLLHFKNDPLTTVTKRDGTPAVELSFKLNLQLPSPDGDPFAIAGHLDRVIVDDADDLWNLDRKTTKGNLDIRYWRQFNPNNQISLYNFAAKIILKRPAKGTVIDAAKLGVNFAEFQRHSIPAPNADQEAEWIRDLYTHLQIAQQYALEDYWPRNDKSCSNYGGCPFQPICSRSPKVRDLWMKSEGYVKKHWNPLENR